MKRFAVRLAVSLILITHLPMVALADGEPDKSSPAVWLIDKYRDVLSKSKVGSCTMYPSCSEYGRQAYLRFPFWKATLVTCDRLNRSDHDSKRYELIWVEGRRRQYDPLPGDVYNSTLFSDSGCAVAPIHGVDVALKIQKPNLTEEEALLDFARYLQALGKYDLALTEYLRLLRWYPSSDLASSARESVMYLYYDQRQYLEAITWAEEALSSGDIGSQRLANVDFWIAAAYIRLGNSHTADEYLQKPTILGDPQLNQKARLLRGYSAAQDEEWSSAIELFQEYGTITGDQSRATSLVSTCVKARSQSKKNPALAGAMGIVPGLGYLYAGYPESAASAFLIDLLLLTASYKAFDDGNTPLGALLGVVGVGWYSGSIYGSISAADRRNDDDLREILMQLNLGFRF